MSIFISEFNFTIKHCFIIIVYNAVYNTIYNYVRTKEAYLSMHVFIQTKFAY